MPDGLRHNDITDYRYDVHSTAALDERHLRGVWEMHWQVARLAATLQQENVWLGLVRAFPGITVAQHALAQQLILPAPVVA
ncbi:MAG: hypothetical protein Q8Q12_11290, partial [bacterium]|nr:hypothetical protein [bacterium]